MDLIDFDIDPAQEFVLGPGYKYPTMTLTEIFEIGGGAAYLRWVAETTNNEYVRRKIEKLFSEMRNAKVRWQ